MAVGLLGAALRAEVVSITVEDRVTGRIEPGLFGQFVELLSPGQKEEAADAGVDPATGTWRSDVRAALDQLHLPVLRYPGGAMVEAPNWRWTQLVDGSEKVTGNEKDRRVNALGLHEFLGWAQEIGAQPILVVKLADVAREIEPAAEIVEQARAFWAYVNGRDDETCPAELRQWPRLRAANGRAEPWAVKDWQLGNEFTWVAVDFLKKKGLGREDVARAYVEAVGRVHDALRALDRSIRFLVEIDMEQERTDIPVAEALHARLKGDIAHMTAHKYFSWGIDRLERDGVPQPLVAMDAEAFWYAAVSAPGTDGRGQAQFDLPMLHTANRLGYPLAVTEWNWNSWWELKGQSNSKGPNELWTKGVAAASMLHGMMNAPGRISLATQSMLVGTNWHIRAVDAAANPARLHPSGVVTSLYGRNHGAERLAWTTKEPLPVYRQPWQMGQLPPMERVAEVDCVVTRGQEALYVHLINRRWKEPVEVTVDAASVLPLDAVIGEVLRLSEPGVAAERFTLEREAGAVWQVTLPPASVQVIKLLRSH